MSFEKNVFINCPFDIDFNPLLRSLSFSILYLGYKPLLCQTYSSADVRITQIKLLIKKSKFSIHDLSRSKAMRRNELPRFNMPFELGLDIGCKEYGGKKLKSKKALILEEKRFHYQRILSDISGQDIENHDNDPQTLITKVRNWFSNNNMEILPGQSEVWIAYNQFNSDLELNLTTTYSKKDIEDMPIGDYLKFANDWIRSFKQKIT